MMQCNYSTIDPTELLKITASEFVIEDPVGCVFWERGANDTYLIHCANTSYALRVFRNGAFSLEANEFEAEALDHLHKQGYPVAYPIARKCGGFIAEIAAPEGPRFILLTAIADGNIPDYNENDNCILVGKSLAQMHRSSNSFKTSRRRNQLDLQWLLEDSVTVINNHISDHPEALKLILSMTEVVRKSVLAAPSDSLDFGLCHGDFHGGNLHVHEGKVTHFDFEECAFGYRLYDVATFKWDCGSGDRLVNRWPTFLQGYESIRPLSATESSLIDTFVILREFAEAAYGIRHVEYFGHNDIITADLNDWCERLARLESRDQATRSQATRNN